MKINCVVSDNLEFYPQPVPRTVSKRLNMWLTLRLLLAIYLMHSSLCLDANYSLAMNYLQLHNYLQLQTDHQELSEDQTKSILSEPIRTFKSYHHLGDDDILDEDTLNLMKLPRCGNKDKVEPISYVLKDNRLVKKQSYVKISEVPTWDSPEYNFQFPLTIGYRNYSTKMSKSDQIAALLHCATIWAEKSGLSFKYVRNQVANVYVSFVPAFPADPGKLGVLAQAESPTPFLQPASSKIDFDARENWVDRWKPNIPDDVVIFQAVLCHEMGHTLGLGHSEVKNAVMHGILIEQTGEVTLHADDISGIRSLYGSSNGKTLVASGKNKAYRKMQKKFKGKKAQGKVKKPLENKQRSKSNRKRQSKKKSKKKRPKKSLIQNTKRTRILKRGKHKT
ncbi:hypothetical protein EB796_002975 [Bugula neritina]|uniref:Peptidase metallopeptidase domain-containing protein n=1 Tax=Bugula neritina TaxID=10212 RepID=A0A7J7KJE9_BUGNE|nr:hypothetical protein EB796_002975 [Bugula neritina]